MNNTNKAKSSSLVVAADSSSQRHVGGGRVGIFSQLFEWNRKFAKKLLSSRKALSLARSKQASTKFGGHEKLPMAKLLLIVEENSGGFPSSKKNGFRGVDDEKKLQKHVMRSPSLVARLMGLESMPVVRREKPNNKTQFGRDENFVVGELNKSNKEEKDGRKTESRPQKIQKTGSSERCAVTRFGSNALQLKSVLLCSRKHHPDLASPVRSPRRLSGRRRASRLIGAATKILEPGLQAKNRTKCALTYSNRMHFNLNNEVMSEEKSVRSPELSKEFGYYESSGAKPLKDQPSCKSCGNPLDVMESRRNMMEEQSSSSCSPSQGSEFSNSEAPLFSIEPEMNAVFSESRGEAVALVADSQQKHGEEQITDRKPPPQEGQTDWHVGSQNYKPHQDASSSTASKYRTQHQRAADKDRSPARLNLRNVHNRRVSPAGRGPKDFVALNRNPIALQNRRVSPAANGGGGPNDSVSLNCSPSARARPRMPVKLDCSKLETERKSCNKQDNSFLQLRTPMQKRRATSIGKQVVNTSPTCSTSKYQRSAARCELVNGKELQTNAGLVDRDSLKSRLANQRDSSTSTVKITFVFSSQMRHRLPPEEMDETQRNRIHPFGINNSQPKRLILDGNDRNMSSLKQLQQRGGALGGLLEQKLKELSHQEGDELGGNQPNRSTAILQKLISVMRRELPISPDDKMADIGQKDNLFCGIQKLSDHAFLCNEDVCQVEANMKGIANQFPDNGYLFSPESVLKASFSNDSCFSSSSSGVRLQPDPMDYSTDKPQRLEPDFNLLDSATSLNKRGIGTQMVTNLVNRISRIGAKLTGYKLEYVKEVILNAELLFGNAALQKSGGPKDFLLGPLLLDKLETFVRGTSSDFFLNFDRTKEANQLRAFLIDCMVEYLDSKCVSHCKLGYLAWRRLQLNLNVEMVIYEVDKEIKRWTHWARGKLLDEIIDSEMSHSLGRWTDFEIEGFEVGAEIGGDILLNLVDEVVVDIRRCRLGIF